MRAEYIDVLIIGAGISGIGSACHLKEKCREKSFIILDERDSLGGTWDLFRYPGIRSDSDMYTYGYNFKPWPDGKAFAEGTTILKYLKQTSAEHNIDDHIRYRHQVNNASWCSQDNCWKVDALNKKDGERVSIRSRFLLVCSGYYDYKKGYTPVFKGSEKFQGTILHPQHWPQDTNYHEKKIIVIGSGATAVTLIPELAKDAEHVIMLQRSPTYMVALPGTDWIANLLYKVLPAKVAYTITRWKNILSHHFIYGRSRTAPKKVKQTLLKLARKELGPDCDFNTNFVPNYNPWDQRLCVVPDADFFHAVRDKRASVLTDQIHTFTEKGILLKSGKELEADIIVTATGFELCVLGNIEFDIDGKSVDFSKKFVYKSMMFEEVPNLIWTFGYINASWTLKADLTAEFTCRVINHMDKNKTEICVPQLREHELDMPRLDFIPGFSSGYMQRKMHLLPKQGDRWPWLNTQNYLKDTKTIGKGPINDGVLQFSKISTDST